MDCSVEAALLVFAQNPPPSIYKQGYIRELFTCYEDENEHFLVPPLLVWDFQENEDYYYGDGEEYEDDEPTSSHQPSHSSQLQENGNGTLTYKKPRRNDEKSSSTCEAIHRPFTTQ